MYVSVETGLTKLEGRHRLACSVSYGRGVCDRLKEEHSLHVQTKADPRVHEPFFLTPEAPGTAYCFSL